MFYLIKWKTSKAVKVESLGMQEWEIKDVINVKKCEELSEMPTYLQYFLPEHVTDLLK